MNSETAEIVAKFFIDQWIGLLGLLIGIAGIILAFIFARSKRPKYVVTTRKLISESSSSIDKLRVLYQGTEIKNLFVTKVAIWNAGAETIQGTDISSIDPLKIFAEGEDVLLDASIIATTRDAIQFKQNISQNGSSIELLFDFLDQLDGAVVQIFHTTSGRPKWRVSGTIKGCKRIERKQVFRDPITILESRFPKTAGTVSSRKRFSAALFFVTPVIVATILYYLSQHPISETNLDLGGLLAACAVITVPYWWMGYMLWKSPVPSALQIALE